MEKGNSKEKKVKAAWQSWSVQVNTSIMYTYNNATVKEEKKKKRLFAGNVVVPVTCLPDYVTV